MAKPTTENGHEHDVAVKKLAQIVAKLFKKRGDNHRAELCNAVGQLSDVPRKENVKGLMGEFWQSKLQDVEYMEMVEILLDFIRIERDVNWTLHMEAFTAMMSWFTTYDHTNYARWGPVYLSDMKLPRRQHQRFMQSRPLDRNKILPVLNILKIANGFRDMTAIIGPIDFFIGKPMLVDIMTAIIGPFGFCTGRPMQVEQMSNDSHYWPN